MGVTHLALEWGAWFPWFHFFERGELSSLDLRCHRFFANWLTSTWCTSTSLSSSFRAFIGVIVAKRFQDLFLKGHRCAGTGTGTGTRTGTDTGYSADNGVRDIL